MYNKAVRKYKAIRKLGAYPPPEGFTGVLQACASGKIGAVADKVILDMVEQTKTKPGMKVPMPDFKLGLTACARGSRPAEAFVILDAIEETGMVCDMECFTLAMMSLKYAPGHLPRESMARQVMRRVRKQPELVPSGEYYGLLLQVLVRAKRFKEAIACFDLMCFDNTFKPGSDHYYAAMKAAAALKDQELVKSLLGEVLMDERRFESQYGPIMELAAKASANDNNWRLAVKLLDKVPAPRSYDAHHTVVASCGRGGNVKLALELFDRMKGEGHSPRRATYNAVLHACSAAGEVKDARALIEEMTASGIRLNVVTYNIALNAKAKAGDARGAIDLLSEMEQAGIEPTVVSFATAINAAAHFNSSALAATLMEAMVPAGLVPNAYVFTAALAACENDPDDTAASTAALKIVDTMVKVGAQKSLAAAAVTRMAAQAKRLMGRDVAVRDLAHLVEDEEALGVALKGRQEEV